MNNKCLLPCTASSYLLTLQIILILNNKCLLLCTDVSINYSCVSVFKQALKQINFLHTRSIVTTTRYFNVEQQLSTALKSTNFQTFCSIVTSYASVFKHNVSRIYKTFTLDKWYLKTQIGYLLFNLTGFQFDSIPRGSGIEGKQKELFVNFSIVSSSHSIQSKGR